MAGYTSRIRVEGETGYATPTRNVTVPLRACVCVFVMCVFWLITRISQLYCSTDPLWSALQTLSPFHLSPSIRFVLFFSFVSLCSQIYIGSLCSFVHPIALSPSLSLCVCVAGVCVCVSVSLVCLRLVCVFIFNCVCGSVNVCQGVCVCLRTRAIREQYMMYPVEVLNILIHRAANLAEPHTDKHAHPGTEEIFDLCGVNVRRETSSNWVKMCPKRLRSVFNFKVS